MTSSDDVPRTFDMIRVDTTATIDRPVEEVAAYLADIERMTEWTDMTASRRLTEGPLREGSQAYAELAVGPTKVGWTYVITDIDPHGGFAFKTVSKGPLGMDGRIRLSPVGDTRTKVDYHVDVRTSGLLRLLEPILRAEVTRNESGEVRRLWARLESADRP